MKNIPPEVTGQIMSSIPLLALGLALFLTSFLMIAAALISLLPNMYKVNDPSQKKKTLITMFGVAVVAAIVGWLVLQGLSVQLIDAAYTMSQVKEE